MSRVFNFSAVPAVLPEGVLCQAAEEMLDWRGSGMSVMEMSHRGKEFISIAEAAEAGTRTNNIPVKALSLRGVPVFNSPGANANVPNMVGQISTAMANAGLNIHNMMNKSRGEMAYTLVDIDSEVPQKVIDDIGGIKGEGGPGGDLPQEA